MIHW